MWSKATGVGELRREPMARVAVHRRAPDSMSVKGAVVSKRRSLPVSSRVLPRLLPTLLLLLIGCSNTPNWKGADEDPVAARQAEIAQRWQQDYERILTEQTTPLATTADEVIERCIEAMGGRQLLTSLQTLSVRTDGHGVAGRFGGTKLLMAPNFIRQERNGGRFVVTDGITAWLVQGDQWQVMQLGDECWHWQGVFSITMDLVDYAAKNVSYELVDTAGFDGGAFYKLRKTISTGKESFIYFDVGSGLLRMKEDSCEYGRDVRVFLDYRDVGGVLLPHMWVAVVDALITPDVALLSYEANPPLDDGLFREPKRTDR